MATARCVRSHASQTLRLVPAPAASPGPGDDHICKLAGRSDVLVKGGLDKLGVLLNHARHVAPAHRHVPLDPTRAGQSSEHAGLA